MRLRLLLSLSGPEYSLRPGDEANFDAAEAARLVAAGIAVPVESPQPEDTENKVAKGREKAISRRGR